MQKYLSVILITIFILAAFFRFYGLPSVPPGLYPDEAMNGSNASEALTTGDFKVFYPENNGREGLFINIQALLLKLFGFHEPWMLRLASAIFGTLTVIGMYYLARELFTGANSEQRIANSQTLFATRLSLLASFFLATSFWHILFSRIGFRAIMAPAFSVWAFALLLMALNRLSPAVGFFENIRTRLFGDPDVSRTRRIIALAAVGGFLFGLGMHSYIAYRAMALVVVALAAMQWIAFPHQRRDRITIIGIFTVVSLVAFAPLGAYFIENPQDFMGRTSQISIFSSETPVRDLLRNTAQTLTMFNIRGDGNWRHNFAGRPQLYWPVGILFLAGVLSSIRGLWRTRNRKREWASMPETFLWIWFAVALLPVVISNEGIPHALRAILLIPPVFAFAGLGGAILLEHIKEHMPRTMRYAFIASMALLIAAYAFVAYFMVWGRSMDTYNAYAGRYVEIGRQITTLPRATPKYILVNGGGTDVRGIPMSAQTVMFITDTFEESKRREKNIYYITSRNEILDDGQQMIVIPLQPE